MKLSLINKKNPYVSPLSIIIVIICCMLVFILSFQGRKAFLINKWQSKTNTEYCYGKVISYSSGGKGSRNSNVRYIVNSDTLLINAPSFLPLGNIMKVTYDKDNQKNAIVSSDAPLSFGDSEQELKLAKVLKKKTFGVNFYYYEYWVGKRKLKGIYIPNISKELPELEVGGVYRVNYLKDSINRSKLLIDKPEKKIFDWYSYKYDSINGFYK